MLPDWSNVSRLYLLRIKHSHFQDSTWQHCHIWIDSLCHHCYFLWDMKQKQLRYSLHLSHLNNTRFTVFRRFKSEHMKNNSRLKLCLLLMTISGSDIPGTWITLVAVKISLSGTCVSYVLIGWRAHHHTNFSSLMCSFLN